jgi:hypothetical protein
MGDGGVRGLAMALSLTGLLATLTGCNNGRPPQDGSQYPANPPPKPPNCPVLPELKNIMLKDGTIADVRIIRDGDETFYIPFSWLAWEAKKTNKIHVEVSDDKYVFMPYWEANNYGRGGYDIMPVECPGVVHEREFKYTTPFVKIKRYDGERSIPPNFSADGEIDKVQFFPFSDNTPFISRGKFFKDGGDQIFEDSSVTGAYVRVSNNYYAHYDFFTGDQFRKGRSGSDRRAFEQKVVESDDWRVTRNSVQQLFDWLKTPVKDRDNDRIFKLGANDQ